MLGETGRVERSPGEWRRIRGDHDGYQGWVHCGYLVETDRSPRTGGGARRGGWSLGATLRVAGQRLRLPLRARVALEGGRVRLPDGRRADLVEGECRRSPT